MIKFLRNHFILIFILSLAVFFRFYHLASIPTGFNDDEAAFGYNAYSILKTAKDEWGNFLPFPVFESFGDWKLVTYLYLTVISQFILGLNEFATRFPSAIIGVFAVATTYFLAKSLFDNKHIALIAALLLAISPWHVIASRNAFESDLLVFSITLATLLFVKGLEKKQFIKFSFIVFSLSFYIYRSSWLFIPLFLLMLILANYQKLKKFREEIIKSIVISAIILLPLAPTVLTSKGQSRFIQESFISGITKVGIESEINEKKGICLSHASNGLCTLLYNKYLIFVETYLTNYMENLSYGTFYENANPTGFQSFMKRSVFFQFEFPFLIAGLIFLFKKRASATKILIPWLLLVPIGASFAGIGNYGRINLIMPIPQIITAFGIFSFTSILKSHYKKIFAVLVSVVIVASMIQLYVDMNFIDPQYSSKYQRYGYKELFNYLESQRNSYDKILISKKIDNSHQYIQYLYFEKVDPNFFFNNVSRSRGEDGWIVLERIGNFKFVPSTPSVKELSDSSLIVTDKKEVDFFAAPIKTFQDLHKDELFEVYSTFQLKEALQKHDDAI